MNRFAAGAATAGILTVSALGFAGCALAAPSGGSSAAHVVNQLTAQGYDVQINGDQTAPLSECTVTDISGLSGTDSKGHALMPNGSTVYVGVDCDDDHDE